MIKEGSVIQVNENIPDWCGCLMIVSEVKSFGCVAGLKIPFKGTAYLRLTSEQYDYIGEAALVPQSDD